MKRPIPSAKRSSLTITLEKRNLLLVEGKDEINFFEKLLKKLGFIDQIQVIEIGGVERMSGMLAALTLMPNFESVRSIGIVRDADDSVAGAEQSVRSILTQLNLPETTNHNSFTQGDLLDLKIGVFIMPGEDVDGTMLEDLCLKTVENQPYLPLIENYLSELEEVGLQLPSNKAKAKVQIYLASQKRIVHSLGLGAQRGYWDFEHICLEDLKVFLHELVG